MCWRFHTTHTHTHTHIHTHTHTHTYIHTHAYTQLYISLLSFPSYSEPFPNPVIRFVYWFLDIHLYAYAPIELHNRVPDTFNSFPQSLLYLYLSLHQEVFILFCIEFRSLFYSRSGWLSRGLLKPIKGKYKTSLKTWVSCQYEFICQ